MDLTPELIRALNDELRRNLPNGRAVAVYDDFCRANDPYEEW